MCPVYEWALFTSAQKQGTPGMDFMNIMLSEENQWQKTISYMIQFVWNIYCRQISIERSRLVVA